MTLPARAFSFPYHLRNVEVPPSVMFSPAERAICAKKERLPVSEWAERYRYVPDGANKGRWRNDLSPWAVEPMDCFALPYVQKIIICAAPQTLKTQVAFNCLSWAIDQDPGPCMYVLPKEALAKRVSKRRIKPMLEATPQIAAMMRPEETSTFHIGFQNGMDLMIVWATSASELSEAACRYMIFDETDKYEAFTGREADPISLGEVRTNTFRYTRKLLYLSTPSEEGRSVIWRALTKEADEIRDRYAVCPICHKEQRMEWEYITWPRGIRDPRHILRDRLAHYSCRFCGMKWDDYTRDEAVRKGRWVPRSPAPGGRPSAIGFHLPSWYVIPLAEVVAAYLYGLEDLAREIAFVTQHKAEPYSMRLETKSESQILARKTDMPPNVVPSWAVALTMGIDTHKYNFRFVIRAWAEDLTSQAILYGELGPSLAPGNALESMIFESRFPVQGSPGVTMGIWRAAIDTGGSESMDEDSSRTEEVYEWLRKHARRGVVFGIKGASHRAGKRSTISVIDKLPRSGKPIPGGLELRLLDTSQFKGVLHWRLERKEATEDKPPESQRFYLHSETDDSYAREFLAEELYHDRKGRSEWRKVRSANHYLDCEVYAAACADAEWFPALQVIAPALKAKRGQPPPAPPPPAVPPPLPPQQTTARIADRVVSFERPGWLNR